MVKLHSETNFPSSSYQRQDDNFKLAILGNKRRVEIYNTGKLKFTQFSTKTGQLVSISRLEELLNGAKTKPATITAALPKVVVKPKSTDAEIAYLLNRGSASYEKDMMINLMHNLLLNKRLLLIN